MNGRQPIETESQEASVRQTASILDESLLRPLTEGECRLLTTIYEPFQAEGRFPVFDYVDGKLYDEGLDAVTLIEGLPTVGANGLYGLTWPSGSVYWPGSGGAVVNLTIAGLVQCPPLPTGGGAQEDAAAFLAVLVYLSERQQKARPTPFEVRPEVVTGEEIRRRLEAVNIEAYDWTLPRLFTLFGFEPRAGTVGRIGTPEEWSVTLSKDLRRYRGINGARDYLERVVEALVLPEPTTKPRYPSSLSLPEAIDFLDAVWQVRFKARLFRLPAATTVVQLSLGCATAEEFASRVSGLCHVLARIEVPESERQKKGDGTLTRLHLFLAETLAEGNTTRVEDAIATLRAIVDIRAGQQHGNRRKEVSAYAQLGIPYPPGGGWDSLWGAIRSEAVTALNALREEVHRENRS